MRAILLADGDGTRWRNHLGAPKHFAPVDGEGILPRAVRLLRERGVDDVWIVGPDEDRYRLANLFIPVKNPSAGDADKFLNSAHMWHPYDRTVVLYGDVYFTDAAMDTIVGYAEREWRLFCRFGGSAYTGCLWGECFAQSFWPEHHAEHRAALDRVVALAAAGQTRRSGGWEHYRVLNGGDPLVHADLGRAIEIDDWTEDFDWPADYDLFMARR